METKLRIHQHQISLIKAPNQGKKKNQEEIEEDLKKSLKEPEPLIELPFSKDFSIKLARHETNILLISSSEGNFQLQVMVQGNVRRDIVTMLTRKFIDRFIEAPDKIKMTSERDFYRKKEEMWNKQVSKLQQELFESS